MEMDKKRWCVFIWPVLGGLAKTVLETDLECLALGRYITTSAPKGMCVSLCKRSGPTHDGIWDTQQKKCNYDH